ncbi:MAG: type III-A CRISPR-associated RAMP protein Csm5 [Calditerrivibrio sp.]|nr:type III-A CRISPR-associated RAMP protein Csm5 [Calditerrivibrio sp.]MCA1980818.1 type III-A CRISPR-associated RAMP protein Csm5 [Calditerrivibrio sp.]
MKVGHQDINKLKLVILTPVHIGTGEEIEPLEYIISKNSRKFYRINFSKFMELLDESKKKEFERKAKLPSTKTIMELRTFIRDNFSQDSMKDAIIETTDVSESFAEKYNNLLNEFASKGLRDVQINQLSIMELYRSGTSPVIPGSSLKGSIRTAILDKLLSSKNSNSYNEKNDYIKNYFHGNKDPFDSLRVSDFVREKSDSGISIGYFVNAPIDKFDEHAFKENLSVMCECLSMGKAYRGDIRFVVDNHLFEKEENYFFKPLRDLISSIDNLFKVCNSHYLPILENELKLIKKSKHDNLFVKALEDNYLNDIKNDRIAILRIGKHSGAEAVTIEGRKIDIRKKKGEKLVKDRPTTTWYFSKDSKPNDLKEIFPCGWIILKRDN